MKQMLAILATLILTVTACSDSGTLPAADVGPDLPLLDKGGSDHQADAPAPDSAPTAPRDYVVSTMLVPATQAAVDEYGHDHDGDQKPDNALGAILLTLSTAVPGLDLQTEMMQNILNGKVVMLMRLTAQDFGDASYANLQSWTGEETTCCATKPCSEAEAQQSCFSGNHSFKIDSSSPQGALLEGSISGGTIQVGPGEVEVLLPIGKYPAKVTLKQARIEATVQTGELLDGKVSGVVTRDELEAKVIPSVAQVLDGELNDPDTKQSIKDAIKQLFDTNGDNQILAAELADNGLIKLLLAGDVDVDKDGNKELSAGVGFGGVTCQIVP